MSIPKQRLADLRVDVGADARWRRGRRRTTARQLSGSGSVLHGEEGDRAGGRSRPRRAIHSSSRVDVALGASPPISPPTPAGTIWSTPASTSYIAPSSAATSSSGGERARHRAPCTSRCPAVRPVENPSAPARARHGRCARHRGEIVGGGVVLGPVAHDVRRARPRGQLRADVEGARGMRSSASRYSPNDSHPHWMPSASAEPGMSSTPSISSIELLVAIGRNRREADAAVAEDRGGHAVPARRREVRVPGRLTVEVGVDVDEARRDGEAVGVELASGTGRSGGHAADLDDHAVGHRDVGRRDGAPVPSTTVPPRITRSNIRPLHRAEGSEERRVGHVVALRDEAVHPVLEQRPQQRVVGVVRLVERQLGCGRRAAPRAVPALGPRPQRLADGDVRGSTRRAAPRRCTPTTWPCRPTAGTSAPANVQMRTRPWLASSPSNRISMRPPG